MRHALCAALLATLPLGALAAPADVQANRQGSDSVACRSGADASCLSAGYRQATSQQQLDQQAPMAAAGCKQGSADSFCAVVVGGSQPAYSAGAGGPVTLTPCYNYGPSTWDGACPAGQLGAITYRQTYSCATQNVVGPNGSTTPMSLEPGAWSLPSQIASTCYTPPPPPPPAPAFTYIYSVSSNNGFCGGSTFGGQSQPILKTIEFTSAGTGARDVMGYCEYSFTTPWGASPEYAWQTLPQAQALLAPMQYLKDKGCSIASEDPAAMDAAIAAERARALAYGYPADTTEKAMAMIRASIGIDDYYYVNYAACPTKVM